ncbi:MAG: hypothetical protein RIB03_08910 [Henriciella sp.]|uniref:hypothetical protein n=1 Tax=Henriciella sp. TaxID=1968823 RepID=UPI0032EC3901
MSAASFLFLAALQGDTKECQPCENGTTYACGQPGSCIVSNRLPIAVPDKLPSIPSQSYTDDLEAQQWMAWSAFWMVLLTGAGVILIAATLRETGLMLQEARKATDAANDSAAAAWAATEDSKDVAARQSRCYIEVIGGRLIKPDPKFATMLTNFSTIEVRCVNHGASIGKDIYCLYEVEVVDLDNRTGSLKWQEFEPEFRSDHRNVAPRSEFSISLNLSAVRRVEEVPFDGRHVAVIRGAVYYRDVFDDIFRSGFVLFGLLPSSGFPDRREIPFGMDQLSKNFPTFEMLNRVE